MAFDVLEFNCMHGAQRVVSALNEVLGSSMGLCEAHALENIARDAAVRVGRMCDDNTPAIWYEQARGQGSIKIMGAQKYGQVITAEVKVTVSQASACE